MFILNQSTTLEERQARGSMVGQAVLVLVIIWIAWVVIVTPIMFVGGAVYYVFFAGPLELVKEPPAIVYYDDTVKRGWMERVVLQVEAKGGGEYEHQWQMLHTDDLEELEAEYGSIADIHNAEWAYPLLSGRERGYVSLGWKDPEGSEWLDDGPSGTGAYYKGKKVPVNSVISLKPHKDYVIRCIIDELGWNETHTRVIRFKAKERKDE
jgi:hypothetical protein